MSLSSFLDQKDVREKFMLEFPLPNFKAQIKPERRVLPLAENPQLLGITFDYLMRFYIKYLNPHATEQEQWVAEIAVDRLKESQFNHLYEQACLILNQAKQNYAAFQKTGQFTDDLLESTLLLGKLDPFVRRRVIDENLQSINSSDLEDLRNLIKAVDPNLFRFPGTITLNPTWGKASRLVGGADGDLIIDDLLVDIKTIKDFTLSRKTFNQLMGYYTLSVLSRIKEPSANELKRLGIYFSRFKFLYEFNVDEVVNPKTFQQFLEWFLKRALSGSPVT
jgi:hypothetical protein